jgi:hypothetical protein
LAYAISPLQKDKRRVSLPLAASLLRVATGKGFPLWRLAPLSLLRVATGKGFPLVLLLYAISENMARTFRDKINVSGL